MILTMKRWKHEREIQRWGETETQKERERVRETQTEARIEIQRNRVRKTEIGLPWWLSW